MLSKNKVLPLSLAIAALLSGCGESTSSNAGSDYQQGSDSNPTTPTTPVDDSFDKAKLLANLADNVITPTFEQFRERVVEMQTAVQNYCGAEKGLLADSGTQQQVDETRDGAQSGWKAAMNQWQRAEVMQVGPLVESNGVLRNRIYSWPVVNRCAVDQDVNYFEQGDINGAAYDISKRTEPRRGLDALEYLLFSNNLEHSCTSVGAPTGWNSRPEQERKVARCEYAEEVSNDLLNNTDLLLDGWSGSNGFAAKLKTAGDSGSDFATAHEAVNRISDAIFYIDSVTKDAKLAKPLGLFANDCGMEVCAQEVESELSGNSLDNIINNLTALQQLYTGSAEGAVGFDDFLIDVGDSDTATTMTTAIEQAIATSNSYDDSLANTLVNNSEKVTQTHQDVKAVTDKLKTDFINSLALELPATAAGDND